ncbi:ATP-binding cassette sub-family G member 20, partial [Caligus rogercresseyi]
DPCRRYSALRNINLVIPRGGITALLGPSASGKTSLLSAIVGLRQPAHAVIERNYDSLGFMPQDLCLHEYFTVEEILMFYGRLHGVVHLPSIPGSRSISNLSGGTKRRVSLCCAIIHRPQFHYFRRAHCGSGPLAAKED